MRRAGKLAAALLMLLAGGSARAEGVRPMLAAGIGGGLDVEPSRLPAGGKQTPTLASFTFEGEVMAREWGILARGVGTTGSIDYVATGFDRLEFSLSAVWRPAAALRKHGEPNYVDIVLDRLALELGLAYQRVLAPLDAANTGGIHLGFHADLPFLLRDDGGGPFIRLILQRSFVVLGDTIGNTPLGRVDPDTPSLQALAALAVAW